MSHGMMMSMWMCVLYYSSYNVTCVIVMSMWMGVLYYSSCDVICHMSLWCHWGWAFFMTQAVMSHVSLWCHCGWAFFMTQAVMSHVIVMSMCFFYDNWECDQVAHWFQHGFVIIINAYLMTTDCWYCWPFDKMSFCHFGVESGLQCNVTGSLR